MGSGPVWVPSSWRLLWVSRGMRSAGEVGKMARRFVMAVALCVLAWSLAPGVSLAASGVVFDLYMNGSCVEGTAPAGNSLHVVWKRPGGKVIDDETFAPFAGGDWGVCSPNGAPLKIGDRLIVTLDGATRRYVVPKLSIAVDRVADTVYGRAPAGSTVHIDHPFSVAVITAPDGTWSYHQDGTDINGSVYGSARWVSPAGDLITIHAFTPQIFLTLGDSTVHVFGHPGTAATITLTRQTTSGARVATLHESFDLYGEVWDHFVDQNGRRMKLKAGDHISAPQIASDMDWIVAGVTTSSNATSNLVSGRCLDAGTRLGFADVVVLDPSENLRGYSGSIVLDGDGHFAVDFDDPGASTGDPDARPGDIQRGDIVRVEC